MRGGLGKCLHDLSATPGPLIDYLVINIMTATTRNAWLLDSRSVIAQLEYIGLLPELEQDLLAQAHPCPVQLLRSITHTNILRVCSQRTLTKQERETILTHSFCFNTVLNDIETFDSNQWALRVAAYGRMLPQQVGDELSGPNIEALAALALCFKSATTLYLLLSTHSLGDLPKQDLRAAKGTLSQNLKLLFQNASTDPNDPLQGQLWKLTVWPLVISAYVKAGWNIGDASVDTDLDHFPSIALALGSRRLLGVAKSIRSVHQKRVAEPDNAWAWDDAFGWGCSFVV